jgi:hypothetical protein
MNEMNWERLAAWGGAIFVVLVLITQLGFGSPPSDGQGVIDFYKAHHSAGLLRQFLSALGGFSFLFFAGALKSALSRDERASSWGSSAALAAAATTTAIAFGQAILIYSLVTRTPTDAAVADALQNMAAVSGRFLSLPLAVFLGSASLAIMDGRSLPSWVAWLGLLGAALNLVSSLRIWVDIGGPLGTIALLALAVWVLVVSVLLATGRGASTAPA